MSILTSSAPSGVGLDRKPCFAALNYCEGCAFNGFEKTVQYVDFGFTSSRQFWAEIVVPAYEKFKVEADRANAIYASVTSWHVHEWIWHEQHPGEDTRNNSEYSAFQNNLFSDCPELAWIRDVADAGKHRGLGRPAEVQRVASGTRWVGSWGEASWGEVSWGGGEVAGALAITLTDGSTHGFAEVLSHVLDYWRAKYFP